MGRELLASVVVFLVALPLCMGVAIASGAPPALGLVAGIVGGLVVGALSGCPLQVSGPAAGLAVMVFVVIRDHGLVGLALCCLVAGAVQITAGVFKLGRWFRAVSPAIIYGMLAGIGVLIAASQLHVMVDSKPQASGIDNILAIPGTLAKALVPGGDTSHQLAALVGLLTIALLVGWERLRPARLQSIPGALVAVVSASAVAALFKMKIAFVPVPDSIFSAISLPSSDLLASATQPTLYLAAIGLAIVASAESLLCATATDKMHGGARTDYDRELLAQGVGNMVCGVLGALPVTGVIVRSSANVRSGASTRLSAVLHGVWLLLFVATLPQVLRLIPLTSLAAILVYTGVKLINWQKARELARHSGGELLVYATTAIAIVATDLLKGIAVGVSLALAKLVWEALKLHVHVRGCDETGRINVELHGAATFVRLPSLARALEDIPDGAHVTIDINVAHLDHACIDLIESWKARCEEQGGVVELNRSDGMREPTPMWSDLVPEGGASVVASAPSRRDRVWPMVTPTARPGGSVRRAGELAYHRGRHGL